MDDCLTIINSTICSVVSELFNDTPISKTGLLAGQDIQDWGANEDSRLQQVIVNAQMLSKKLPMLKYNKYLQTFVKPLLRDIYVNTADIALYRVNQFFVSASDCIKLFYDNFSMYNFVIYMYRDRKTNKPLGSYAKKLMPVFAFSIKQSILREQKCIPAMLSVYQIHQPDRADVYLVMIVCAGLAMLAYIRPEITTIIFGGIATLIFWFFMYKNVVLLSPFTTVGKPGTPISANTMVDAVNVCKKTKCQMFDWTDNTATMYTTNYKSTFTDGYIENPPTFVTGRHTTLRDTGVCLLGTVAALGGTLMYALTVPRK